MDSSHRSSGTNEDTEKTTVLAEDSETIKTELKKAKEQEACLIIIRGTPQGHRFFLTQKEMIIGRDPMVEITLADQSISRRHAKITKTSQTVTITDLGSSNGTFVNDKKLGKDPVTLAKEDMIKLGNSILKFLPAGELEILFYGNLGSAAHTDPLTRIYNKGYLLEALDAEFKRAKALHTDLSMVFFDLDHFKKINDTHGHDAGDYVLKEISNLIKISCLRAKDIFARYGGEEFVILLGQTSAPTALQIAEQIRSKVESHPFIYEGKKLSITCSLGVTQLQAEMESAQSFLKAADKALYSAKAGGRNRAVLAD